MKNQIATLILVVILLSSCSIEPKPIQYGSDACHSCKMNIVQQKFGAEIVTKKGKVFKFDAVECMIQSLEEMEEDKIGLQLVIDFNNPTQFMDASTSYHLKSEKIPSPMGAFLSGYSSKEIALEMQAKYGGEVLDWESLKERRKK